MSRGAYSDYGVMCCFTTLELAQTYCARVNGITLDEQKQMDAVDDAEPADRSALKALPQKLSRLRQSYGAAFVETFDFYDFVPGERDA